jgi:hypothetical protein
VVSVQTQQRSPLPRATGSVGALSISPYDRVTLCGMTGSGKTYLARGVLSTAPRLIICDAKGLLETGGPEGWDYVSWDKGYPLLKRGEPARVYIPPLHSDEAWEEKFRQIFKLRGVAVYVDELYQVGPAAGSEGLRALYTQGRQLNIGMWASVQRPAFVPKYVFSEASYIFMFNLQLEDDLETMGKQIGRRVMTEPLGWYGFWVYSVRTRRLLKYGKVEYRPIPRREGVRNDV